MHAGATSDDFSSLYAMLPAVSVDNYFQHHGCHSKYLEGLVAAVEVRLGVRSMKRSDGAALKGEAGLGGLLEAVALDR